MPGGRSVTGNARVLVIAGPAHGDILLVTPLLRALRRACPGGVLDVLVYQGQSAILEGNTDIDDIVTAPRHPGFRGYLQLLGRIFRRYDVAISNKQTDRVIGYTIMAGRRRIAVVPADRQRWKQRMMSAWVPYDHDNVHTVTQNNALGGLLGLEPCWEISLPESARSPAVVDELLPAEAKARPFAVLHVNPGLPHKRWHTEGWAAVARELHHRNMPLLLTGAGTAAERDHLESAKSAMALPVTDLSGCLSFADAAELLSRCALFIGTDTVTTHMAAATGVPTIALFGPESSRVWGPWPRGHVGPETPWNGGSGAGEQRAGNVFLLQSEVPCPTCRPGYCLRRPERDRSCVLMQTLHADQVIAAIRAIL